MIKATQGYAQLADIGTDNITDSDHIYIMSLLTTRASTCIMTLRGGMCSADVAERNS